MCCWLKCAALPSLFIILHLNEMLGDIKVMLQVNKVFKPTPPPPWVSVQGAAGWGEDTVGPTEERRGDRKVERREDKLQEK